MQIITRRDFTKLLLGTIIVTQLPFAPRIYRKPEKLLTEPPLYPFPGQNDWQAAVHLVEPEGWLWMPGVRATDATYGGLISAGSAFVPAAKTRLESEPLEATRLWHLDGLRVYGRGQLFHEEVPIRCFPGGLKMVAGETVTFMQDVTVDAGSEGFR